VKNAHWIASIALGALLQPALHAADAGAGIAFPTVQEAGSARAIALGSTYVGIAEGSAALLWNPAGLATLSSGDVALNHKSSFLDSYQEIVTLGLPLGKHAGLGASLNYNDNGSFAGRDSNGQPTSDFNARGYGASIGLGMGGPAGLSFGGALKMNRQDLAETSESAYAADLGLLWSPSSHFTLGAAYSNLGPSIQDRPLAQGLRVGASTYLGVGSDFQWLLAVSSESLNQVEGTVHFGVESTLYQLLALRAGYSVSVPKTDPADNVANWTLGAGVVFKDLRLDYAFVPTIDLGNTERLSLTYAFGSRS
jgi:hypothetical protein